MSEQGGTEAAAEETMEMGYRCGLVKIGWPRQGEIVIGGEAGMHVGVLEHGDEGCDRRDIDTQPVQEIAQQRGCLSGV
jgi:hypothetical protein